MNISNPRLEDWILLTIMTGGVLLVYLAGCYIYIYIRTLIRRFIRGMPDWANF